MTFSLYQASVPVQVQLLTALAKILDTAAAHAAAREIEPAALLDARLYPDMWPFKLQVMTATGFAFRPTARLAGLPIPAISEATSSFADLQQRVAETLAFLHGVDPAAVDAGVSREISFPTGGSQRTMNGPQYLFTFALPNFYFHLTTAYDILRHNGLPLGKRDFLGSM